MDSNRLWAKRWDNSTSTPPRSAYLHEHLKDVHVAACQILIETGADQLQAFGLSDPKLLNRYRKIVLLAAAIHDLGKANEHFQKMILGKRHPLPHPQGLRHEWVTILMMSHLREWLLPAVDGREEDMAIAEWAVAGHHPAFKRENPPQGIPFDIGTAFMGHPDFQAALEWMRTAFASDLGSPPVLKCGEWADLGVDNVEKAIRDWNCHSQKRWLQLKKTPVKFLVSAAKLCLIAADVAGSAIPRIGDGQTDLTNWIRQAFDSRPAPADLERIAKVRLGGDPERSFQTEMAESKSRVTLVKAGCGSGKTVGAYLWAGRRHPDKRLYFCYPTTGTATAGFADYLHHPNGELYELGTRLFHSRSEVDFELILSNGDDDGADDINVADRIEALEAWSTPVAACTVDTVLGVMANHKRGRFAWPALAQSAFIFDEIHAYDETLFGVLLRFLKDLKGLPVLLMTASLPESRVQAILDVLEENDESPTIISGPKELESLPRYFQSRVNNNDPFSEVENAFAQGEKILWICNTVERVLAAAERCQSAGLPTLIYHSRFRYEDRVQRHANVIKAFNAPGPAIAICSQVAEMSLDLSADLLVSDLAPVPALIQRLGRLNRRASAGDTCKPFCIVEVDTPFPYAKVNPPRPFPEGWPEQAREWLQKLPADQCSQRDLANCWEHLETPELVPGDSSWLNHGPDTCVGTLREINQGLSVILQRDQSAVNSRPKLLGRYIIPMTSPPERLAWKELPRIHGVPVVPPEEIDYQPERGARWRK